MYTGGGVGVVTWTARGYLGVYLGAGGRECRSVCTPYLQTTQQAIDAGATTPDGGWVVEWQHRGRSMTEAEYRAKSTCNSGQPWSAENAEQLRRLVAERVPVERIAVMLGRSASAVRTKAHDLGISLRGRDGNGTSTGNED
jgi:hypothetical protein